MGSLQEETTETHRKLCDHRGSLHDAATSQGTPGPARNWKRQRRGSSMEALDRAQPSQHLDCRLAASRTVGGRDSVDVRPQMMVFCYRGLGQVTQAFSLIPKNHFIIMMNPRHYCDHIIRYGSLSPNKPWAEKRTRPKACGGGWLWAQGPQDPVGTEPSCLEVGTTKKGSASPWKGPARKARQMQQPQKKRFVHEAYNSEDARAQEKWASQK